MADIAKPAPFDQKKGKEGEACRKKKAYGAHGKKLRCVGTKIFCHGIAILDPMWQAVRAVKHRSLTKKLYPKEE